MLHFPARRFAGFSNQPTGDVGNPRAEFPTSCWFAGLMDYIRKRFAGMEAFSLNRSSEQVDFPSVAQSCICTWLRLFVLCFVRAK